MDDALRRRASETPDKLAACMADGSGKTSYTELDRNADRIAALFQALGLNPGDTVALLHDNDVQVLEWWWGARRAGIYYVPLSTKLTPSELAYIIEDCSAAVLLATADCAALARQAGALVAGTLVLTTDPDAAPAERLGDRLARLDRTTPTPVERAGRELMYSSGTTGRPKGIRRALPPVADLHSLPDLEQRMRSLFRFDTATVYLSVAPLYHASGRFLNRVIEEGGSVVISRKFEAEPALAAIAAHRVTHSQWVPTMFVRLLDLPAEVRERHDLSSHRVALHAAAPCPVAVKGAMIDWWGPIIDEFYGGTENAGVTFISATDWLAHPGSVGRSITGAIHILADDGSETELPPGEIGQIYFSGGVPFQYLNAPAGGSPLSSQGYATYGDLGHVDDEGYLYISDRRNDLIITGGVNVYPKEIELVLESHPSVAEAAVIGLPDPVFGQRVQAIIRLSAGAVLPTSAELDAFCRERLSTIKCPRGVDVVDEFPRNENGKLLKRILRDRYVGGGAAS